jgi:hypothetical protein
MQEDSKWVISLVVNRFILLIRLHTPHQTLALSPIALSPTFNSLVQSLAFVICTDWGTG